MKIDFETARIFLRPGFVDMRCGVDRLLSIITNEMNMNALSDSVFVFCGKNHRILKFLVWDKNAFFCGYKKLQKSTWSWPHSVDEAKEITREELHLLLNGVKLWKK